MGFFTGLKAGFTLYGLGFSIGAGLAGALCSIALSVGLFVLAAVLFRR